MKRDLYQPHGCKCQPSNHKKKRLNVSQMSNNWREKNKNSENDRCYARKKKCQIIEVKTKTTKTIDTILERVFFFG